MRKLRWDASEIKTYQEFFTKEDFVQINNYTRRPQWGYGNISNPGEPSAPFFTMPLMKVLFLIIKTPNYLFKLAILYF